MRRPLAALASGALVASTFALAPLTAAQAAPSPAQAGPPALTLAAKAPTASSYAKKVDAAAKKAAKKKAGKIRTERWTWGGAVKASKTKNWWVAFGNATGASLKDGQSWKKANAYRKAVVSKLQKDGLAYRGSSSLANERVKSYANWRYACTVSYTTKAKHAVPTVRLACVKKSKVISAVKRLAPLVKAYGQAGNSTKGLAFSGGTVKPSREATAKGYKRASASIGSAIPSGGARGIFAKAPGQGWQYLFSSQESPSACEAYEETSAGSIAWVGEPCYRLVGDDYVESKVEAWITG